MLTRGLETRTNGGKGLGRVVPRFSLMMTEKTSMIFGGASERSVGVLFIERKRGIL
jgi:hypothetical protein